MYIVEDGGFLREPSGPKVRFRLLSEGRGESIRRHLKMQPTLTAEAYRGFPLSVFSTTPREAYTLTDDSCGRLLPIYVRLDSPAPVSEGDRVELTGGLYALGCFATGRDIVARWGGPARSARVAGLLADMSDPLPAVVEKAE